jgi:hypothetical protein
VQLSHDYVSMWMATPTAGPTKTVNRAPYLQTAIGDAIPDRTLRAFWFEMDTSNPRPNTAQVSSGFYSPRGYIRDFIVLFHDTDDTAATAAWIADPTIMARPLP